MKKRFFKKLKKYVLVLSCVLSCLVILSFPVSADDLITFENQMNNNNIQISGTASAADGSMGVFSTRLFKNDLSSDFTISQYGYSIGSNYLEDRLNLSTVNNSVLFLQGSKISFTIKNWLSYWTVKVGPNENLEDIFINTVSNVRLHFRDKDGSWHIVYADTFIGSFSNLTFTLDSVPCDATAIVIGFQYNPYNFRDSAGFTLYDRILGQRVYSHTFDFIFGLNISNSYTLPPASERPIYSKPSSGGIDNTTSQEQIIVDNSVQDAQNEFGKLSNSIANIVQDTRLYNSILGVRYMFERLLQESPFLSDILVVSLICGVVLLFSNFIVNRRRD